MAGFHQESKSPSIRVRIAELTGVRRRPCCRRFE